MEIKANHVLIGAFTLATVIGAFVFLVWLGQFSFEQRFDDYQIIFDGGVSGIEVASEVRYSGIKVGEVSAVTLDPEDPRRVRVIVRLSAGTPVKEDTVASIESGSLPGVGIIQLAGGSPDSKPLVAEEGLPTIPARLTDLQQLTSTAPNLLAAAASFLARGNALLSAKNRQAVAEILENARLFSGRLDAVMSNIETASARLDSITKNLDQTMADASKDIGPALAAVQTAGTGISEVADSLNKMIIDVRPSFRDFARGGLTGIVSFVQEARQLTATLERLASKIESDPGGFLSGTDSPEYKGKK